MFQNPFLFSYFLAQAYLKHIIIRKSSILSYNFMNISWWKIQWLRLLSGTGSLALTLFLVPHCPWLYHPMIHLSFSSNTPLLIVQWISIFNNFPWFFIGNWMKCRANRLQLYNLFIFSELSSSPLSPAMPQLPPTW